jgi:hypothetical protein
MQNFGTPPTCLPAHLPTLPPHPPTALAHPTCPHPLNMLIEVSVYPLSDMPPMLTGEVLPFYDRACGTSAQVGLCCIQMRRGVLVCTLGWCQAGAELAYGPNMVTARWQ